MQLKHERRKKLSTGKGLKPIVPLDISDRKLSVGELVRRMGQTGFGAREVGEATKVLYEMVADPKCFVVMTLSGALIPIGFAPLVIEMIERGMIHALVTTGAMMAHGFVEATGRSHFQAPRGKSDRELYLDGYNRIYDTLEPEKNLDDIERIVGDVLVSLQGRELGTFEFHWELGKYLSEHAKSHVPPGILLSAWRKGVRVYTPDITNSEIGLDISLFNRTRRELEKVCVNPFLDLEHFTELIRRQKRLGIFTIGGGGPRNWAQQVAPYLDIIEKRLGKGKGGGFIRYHYGLRICPDSAHYGHLSGSPLEEAVSWGKLVPREEGGLFAEVHHDASICWPFILRAVIEQLGKRKIEKRLPKAV